jgi:hypothetical protein
LNCNFGKILVKGQPASTGDMALAVYKGAINDSLKAFPPRKFAPIKPFCPFLTNVEYFVDVQDTGVSTSQQ